MTPLAVRNLTLHALSERELSLGREAGLALQPEPLGVEAGRGEIGFRAASDHLRRQIEHCAAGGEGVLLGGYVALWVSALLAAMGSGKPLPPLFYFETERLRDAHDRFVFEPLAIRRLAAGAPLPYPPQ